MKRDDDLSNTSPKRTCVIYDSISSKLNKFEQTTNAQTTVSNASIWYSCQCVGSVVQTMDSVRKMGVSLALY